jgi:tripartite-type tricarboxylate transporter receptor subunit TctC
MKISRRALGAVTALWAAGLARPGWAAYPDRPIRVVVPFTAGGGTDIVARSIMNKVGEMLGAAIVIDNRGGAGGMVGTEIVAKAAPDGLTLGLVSASHSVNPTIYKTMPYDSVKSFQPITQLCVGPGVVVVNPALPIHSIADLIAYVRAHPGAMSFASAGVGTPPHLAGELFKAMAGLDIVHVAYRGNSQALLDVVGGRVAMSFPTIPSALPGIRAGQLRALAVTTAKPALALPAVPTVAASGLPGYEASSWYGLVAPANLPAPVLEKIHAATVQALATPDVHDRLVNEGLEPVGDSPESFAHTIIADIGKWAALARDYHVQLN